MYKEGYPKKNCEPIARGIGFLKARLNPELGLLNESPITSPNRYWLTNDNALAAYALSQLGQVELSDTIYRSLHHYGFSTNGYIEVLWGLPVAFPPNAPLPVLVTHQGNSEIWQEFHMEGAKYEGWTEYANLGFLAALNEYHQGNIPSSLLIYSDMKHINWLWPCW